MENLNKQMLRAALEGDLAMVENLVREGADINYTDGQGTFAMFGAAWEGNIEALELFYSLGAKITFEEANLLCNAAYNGKAASVNGCWIKAKTLISLLEKREKMLCITRSAKRVRWTSGLKL